MARTQATPKIKYIYAFCDTSNPSVLKIGDAYDIIGRFHSETRTASFEAEQYKLLKIWKAIDKNGNEFRDYAVHEVLRNSGYVSTKTRRKVKKGQEVQDNDAILKSLLEGEFSLEQNSLTSKAGSEWFIFDTEDGDIQSAVEIVNQAVKAVYEGRETILKEKHTFAMRDEQRECCETTANYIRAHAADQHPCRYLWNCKMRFGKTFTAYQLALAMGWKRILVLTFKPVVRDSWRADLYNHRDFENWQFVDKDTETTQINSAKKTVAFYSFQYLMTGNENLKKLSYKDMGSTKSIENQKKLKAAIGGEWDCVILDEYHFGAWRHIRKLLKSDYINAEEKQELQELQKEIQGFEEENNDLSEKFSIDALRSAGFESHHFLYLSGTPFRAMMSGEFNADQVYHWTYIDEQKKKAEECQKHSEKYRQYEWLPKVELYTYEITRERKDKIVKTGKNEFDLNAFFEADDDEFKESNHVKAWLTTLKQQGLRDEEDDQLKSYPLDDMRKKHLVWFLPSVASCRAMEKLLKKTDIGDSYAVLCCAGNEAGIGYEALRPVRSMIANAKLQCRGSITLTCGKLLTGVTIPEWEGIFMLCNCKSAENYLQAAFRVQSTWPKGNKKTCCIFDFAPVRAIRMVYRMAIQSGENQSTGIRDSRGYLTDFIQYMPIIAHRNDGMKPMSVDDILNAIANITSPKDVHEQWGIKELFNTEDAFHKLKGKDLIRKLASLGLPSEYHGKGRQATFDDEDGDVSINKPEGVEIEPPKRHKNPTTPSGNIESDKSAEERQRAALQAKLKFIAERLRIYMYLTDFPEIQYKDIFEPDEKYKKDCDEMFRLSMGYQKDSHIQFTLEDLRELCNLGIINTEEFNLAVHSFYDIEEKQFRNMGIERNR